MAGKLKIKTFSATVDSSVCVMKLSGKKGARARAKCTIAIDASADRGLAAFLNSP